MIIGIDPDTAKSGVAVIENGVIKSLHSLPFDELIDFVVEHYAVGGVVVAIEDPAANKPTFFHGTNNPRVRERISQNVGAVKVIAEQICTSLAHRQVEVTKVAPLRGPVKRQAKKNSAYFNKLTGWVGKTNEDKRDAALIALYGVRGKDVA